MAVCCCKVYVFRSHLHTFAHALDADPPQRICVVRTKCTCLQVVFFVKACLILKHRLDVWKKIGRVCACVWIICCLIFRNVKLPNDLQNSR